MPDIHEQKILSAWVQNAQPWIDAIANHQIESRVAVTNQAIIDAVLAEPAQTILDIGCGEGWLVRSLTSHGLDVFGVDGVPELIEQARQYGGGRFQVLTYDAISNGQLRQTFDTAVCNFSLLGQDSTLSVFRAMPKLLKPDGRLIIQTLTPSYCLWLRRLSKWLEIGILGRNQRQVFNPSALVLSDFGILD